MEALKDHMLNDLIQAIDSVLCFDVKSQSTPITICTLSHSLIYNGPERTWFKYYYLTISTYYLALATCYQAIATCCQAITVYYIGIVT